VVDDDQNTIFAIAGSAYSRRWKAQLDRRLFSFVPQPGKCRQLQTKGVHFYDALGVGMEFITEGHVFYLNFTNSTELLENRFIPRTVTSWSKASFAGLLPLQEISIYYGKKVIEINSSHSYE
jgi:hypothetical protein